MRTFELREGDHYTVQYHQVFNKHAIRFIRPELSVWLNQFGVIYTLHYTLDSKYTIGIEDDRQAAHFKLTWM